MLFPQYFGIYDVTTESLRVGSRYRLAGEKGIQRVPQIVDSDLLAGLAKRGIEIIDPAAVSDFGFAVEEHGFGRDCGIGSFCGDAAAIDNRGDVVETVVVEMLAHRGGVRVGVFA